MEFKVFCIWGQPLWVNWYRSTWRPGGVLFANLAAMEYHGKVNEVLDWVDWENIMNMARKFSIGKDLVRAPSHEDRDLFDKMDQLWISGYKKLEIIILFQTLRFPPHFKRTTPFLRKMPKH
eukprot:scaffold102642_cov35-Attheya_sp.AAC.1